MLRFVFGFLVAAFFLGIFGFAGLTHEQAILTARILFAYCMMGAFFGFVGHVNIKAGH